MTPELLFGICAISGFLFVACGLCAANSFEDDSTEQKLFAYFTFGFCVIAVVSFIGGIIVNIIN